MKKTLKEKFEILDILFNNHRLFFTELVLETTTLKRFAVKTLKDNSEAVDALSKKVNDLIRDKEFNEIDHNKFAHYSDQLKELTEEFEVSAEIVCTLSPDNIKVEIKLKDEQVIFKFKEDDSLDTLIHYLDKNLGQKLLSRK